MRKQILRWLVASTNTLMSFDKIHTIRQTLNRFMVRLKVAFVIVWVIGELFTESVKAQVANLTMGQKESLLCC